MARASPVFSPPRALFLLAGAAAVIALAAGFAAAGGTPEPIAGDFTVGSGERQVLTNRTLVVDGNVLVGAGGTLELYNATILVNLSANGSRAFTVASGGTFRAFDLDGEAGTSFDRSLVGSADPGRRYVARFASGSNVLFARSALSGFGYSLLTPGLLIESSNVTFLGASLEAYVYMRVEAASPSFEGTILQGDGTGSNYFFGSGSTLSNCTITRQFVGLSAGNRSAVTLRGALVRDTVFAFAANGSTLAVQGSTVNNSTSGMFLTNGSAAAFTDVAFDPAAVAFGDGASTLTSFRTFTVRVVNGAAEGVRNATVTLRSATNATLFTGSTGSAGAVGPAAIVAFSLNASGRADTPNVTASAAKGANATARAFSPLTEPSPITLVVLSNVDPLLSLVGPAPGSVLLASASVVFQATASDPDNTPGGVQIAWRSSLQGPLGSGTTLTASLTPGNHTIEVEARDQDDGVRRISFNVSAEAGTAVAFGAEVEGLWYNATIWKTSRGAFALTPYDPAAAPLLAFGKAVMVHATTGELAWAFAVVEVPYDPAALPYGTFEANLTVMRWAPGADLSTPGTTIGSTLNSTRRVLTVNLTAADGLGTLMLVAVRGNNTAPSLTVPETLYAVVGVPFSYSIDGRDTPGEALVYTLQATPAWLAFGNGGVLSGTPQAADRGLAEVNVLVTDPDGAWASASFRIFVSGTAKNQPPQLLNVRFTPAAPVGAGTVLIEVTYFDPDGDLPLILEVVIDGDPSQMVPAVVTDINTSDGKLYGLSRVLAVGAHNITFRTSDGAPGREDVTLAPAPLTVAPDSLRTLNNWFLALFVSLALTLALYLYFRARAPPKAPPKAPDLPDDRPTFLEGEALKKIPPQPKMAKAEDREEELEREADEAAAEASSEGATVEAKLKSVAREEMRRQPKR